MLTAEELPRHLGPDPGPLRGRQRSPCRPVGGLVDRGEPCRNLTPEGAVVPIGLERQAQPRDLLGGGHVGFLRDQLGGQRMAALAEQVPHLFRGHRITDARPSIPATPEPTQTPGVSPRSV